MGISARAFNKNRLIAQNEFTARGEELRNGFANRFGGGFSDTSDLIESFNKSTEEIVANAINTDTKAINEMISSAIDEKMGEIKEEVTSSYSKPSVADSAALPNFMNAYAGKFNFVQGAIEEEIKKASNSASDPGMQNVAAAMDTTKNEVFSSLEGLNFNDSGVGFNSDAVFVPPTDAAQIEQQTPIEEVIESIQEETAPIINEPTIVEDIKDTIETAVENTVPMVIEESITETIDETIDDKFKETLNKISQKIDDSTDNLYDSIDVVGSTINDTIEDSDSIPDKDEDSYKKVITEVREMREEDDESSGNEWERFVKMYSEFYGGDRAGVVLKSLKQLEGSNPNLYSESMNKVQVKNPTSLNLQEILDSVLEPKNNMAVAENQKSQPIVINNNKTMTVPVNESKTGRVFSNENTFNRLAQIDSNHPQYMSYTR